ncbi:nopaline dehydrogenase [Pollutimonas nitritireducens]|uniref:Nopaline dehydrogenase n=1 Tax=Pollutimonas nitritireducens TaxID=2045209 RepID=A0A2N4UKY9_9BURK|nr:FAD-dependent oxidoreductase [Pollutimonas nitritireducens]PLC55697.1 nopaline dehydrogenase [Pollutimonas nitritireducens]
MPRSESYDVIVIGAGMVGAAVAYGLASAHTRVLVLDGGDTDFRAAKANFGLVWVQGKGWGNPAYQRLSHEAAQLWPAFADQLMDETGICLDYESKGGLNFCVGESQLEARRIRLSQWHGETPERVPCTQMLDRTSLRKLLPGVRLGKEVSGASFGTTDGHVNPLRLLAALQKGLVHRGGTLLGNHAVKGVSALSQGGFSVQANLQRFDAAQIVIAAGLGSSALGPMIGLDVPLRPQRGQLMVTERLAPLLPLPASGIRQTREGTVMIGLTQEDVGFDLSTTSAAAAQMSRQALQILPDLARARLIRQWSCLRIMTPDGCPVYAESAAYPGAWIALCHSGVTLASFHAGPLADSLRNAKLDSRLNFFHHERFDVSSTE